jgi:hypothetical protein
MDNCKRGFAWARGTSEKLATTGMKKNANCSGDNLFPVVISDEVRISLQ